MFYPIESRIYHRVTLQKHRLMARAGQVLVKTGDLVSAEEVIGRYHPAPCWHYFDIAGALRVPPEKVESLLSKHPGDVVERDEIIASKKGSLGLFRRVCKSPVTGIISALHEGRMLIEEQGESADVRALVRGRVVHVIPFRGAVVEAQGAFIRAAWGSGPSAFGVLKVLADTPASPLLPKAIDISSHGAILVAGWCSDPDALRQAENIQARGVILGSLDIQLMASAQALSIPIIVIEGFGAIPMNGEAFSILKNHHGKDVSLFLPSDGGAADGAEIFIPLAAEEMSPALEKPAPLRVGTRVHIIGYPRLGGIGTITEMVDRPRRVEAGVFYEGVMVELDNHETLFVPWCNVDPITPASI